MAYKLVKKSNPNKLWLGYVVRMKTTHTYQQEAYHKEVYLASTYFSPVKLAKLQGYAPEGQDEAYFAPSSGMRGFISAIWLWLRCCVYVVTGHGDPYESDVEFVERPHPYSRARRHRAAYFAKRGGIVPARNLRPFCGFGSRRITPAQFRERLCRLSGWGRIHVYRMVYYAPRLVRYALLARFARGDFRAPCGLCAAHLWPD